MKKKVTACLTAIAMVGTVAASAAAMTACGSADLTILLCADNNEDDFYRDYFKSLGNELGISIKYEGKEKKPYDERLGVLIGQGNMPDIFYVRPNEILTYARYLQPVDDYVTAQNALPENQREVNFEDIIPTALDIFKYDAEAKEMNEETGRLYAFPKDLSTKQFGYNKLIIQQYTDWIHNTAKLPLPWELGTGDYATKLTYTWSEYRTICEHISSTPGKAISNGQITNNDEIFFGCDVPDIEIIAKSYGLDLMTDDTLNINNETFKKAVKYQAELCTSSTSTGKPAADKVEASYANFTVNKVAFYSECGTWQIGAYNKAFNKEEGDDNWGLMPTPVETAGDSWNSMITTAGFVVSKSTKDPDLAKKVAASLLSYKSQEKLVNQGLMLPLMQSRMSAYIDPTNNDRYSPSTRAVFAQVISGEHGFAPTEYSTKNPKWHDMLAQNLDDMHKADSLYHISALQYFNTKINWATWQSDIQNEYEEFNK